MTTTAELITSVRGDTFQLDTGRLPDSLIVQWANEEQDEIRRYVASFAPQLFTKVSADLTVTAGGTSIDVSTLTDLEQIQAVQRFDGRRYVGLRPAGWNADAGAVRKWEQRGFAGSGCVVDIFPTELAPGTYRIRYTSTPTALSTGTPNAVIALPPGGARVLIGAVSARVRAREEEDPTIYTAWRTDAYREMKASLMPKGMVVHDATGRY